MVASVKFVLVEIAVGYCSERQAAGIAVANAKGIYRGRRPATTKSILHGPWNCAGGGLKIGRLPMHWLSRRETILAILLLIRSKGGAALRSNQSISSDTRGDWTRNGAWLDGRMHHEHRN